MGFCQLKASQSTACGSKINVQHQEINKKSLLLVKNIYIYVEVWKNNDYKSIIVIILRFKNITHNLFLIGENS